MEEELFSEGVSEAKTAIALAKQSGCSVDLVMEVIQHYRACKPMWGPGALYRRITLLNRGQSATDHWPPPSREFERAEEAKREAEQAKQRAKRRKADQGKAEKDAAHRKYLESKHGKRLDELPIDEVRKLIAEAFPKEKDFYLGMLQPQSTVSGILRIAVLEHMDRENERAAAAN